MCVSSHDPFPDSVPIRLPFKQMHVTCSCRAYLPITSDTASLVFFAGAPPPPLLSYIKSESAAQSGLPSTPGIFTYSLSNRLPSRYTMATPSPSQSPEQMQAELLNGPAAKPPVGVVPNFVDPTNLDTAVITVLSVCLIIGTLAVLIRTYTKLMLIKSIAYEDCKCESYCHSPSVQRGSDKLQMLYC